MMHKLIQWLSAHRTGNVVLLIAFYLFSVRGHMLVSQPFYWLVKKTSNAQANVILLSIITPLLLWALFTFYRELNKHPLRRTLSIHWSLFLFLAVLSFNTIMPYNAEFMHFPQYMVIAILIFPLIRNAGSSLIFCALLGFIDEVAQYLLYFSIHFDYNDVSLDILGAAGGILTVLTYVQPETLPTQSWKKIFTHPLYLFWNLLIISLALLFFTKVLVLYCDQGPWSWHRLESGRISGAFWEYKKWGPVWHRMFPYEGSFWLLILPLLFYRFHFFQLHNRPATHEKIDQPV